MRSRPMRGRTHAVLASVALTVALAAPTRPAPAQAATDGRASPTAAPTVAHRTVDVNGVSVFYREAGPKDAPVILLLHGFPSSSHQFRNLIPLLSHKYRVVAPDLPGFGFTEVPAERQYKYTFENIATSIGAFLDVLEIKKFSPYVFDYGGPTGFRLALQRPEA